MNYKFIKTMNTLLEFCKGKSNLCKFKYLNILKENLSFSKYILISTKICLTTEVPRKYS